MTQTILVSSLRIEAVSGGTCYAGENGFSSVSAEVECADPALIRELSRAASEIKIVNLRCGKLDVTGTLTDRGVQGPNALFVVRLDSIDYGVPGIRSDAAGSAQPERRPHRE